MERNISDNQNLYIETTVRSFDSEITTEMSNDIELELAATTYSMRREFKRANKRLRRLYSTKEPKSFKSGKTVRTGHYINRRALA